jgi:hypothetical protein
MITHYDYKLLYHNIINKYQLDKIKFDNNIYDIGIDQFINNLYKYNKNYENDNLYKYKKNIDYVVYINDRLVNFLNENDIVIDNILFYSKLYRKIFIIVDLYRCINIKNIDSDIYSDIQKISESNYMTKKVLIKIFIDKYSSNKDTINIII